MVEVYMQLKFLDTRVKAGTRNPTRILFLIFFSIFSIDQCYAAPVTVGTSLGGGTVFCVSDTPDTSRCVTTGSGDYGLIMANVDQANYDSNSDHGVTWSSESKVIHAHSADDSSANTATIIAAHPNDNGTNNAAWLCHNYNTSEGYIGPGLSA
jgi:hypothetical protein